MKNISKGFDGFIEKESGIKGALFPDEDSDADDDVSDSDSEEDNIKPITFNADRYLDLMSQGLSESNEPSLEEYIEAMDHELAATHLADDFDKSSGNGIDVETNLLRNVYSSVSAQQGLAGPASNIIGSLGLALPKSNRLD
jgi:hypothetical protein